MIFERILVSGLILSGACHCRDCTNIESEFSTAQYNRLTTAVIPATASTEVKPAGFITVRSGGTAHHKDRHRAAGARTGGRTSGAGPARSNSRRDSQRCKGHFRKRPAESISTRSPKAG